MADLSELKDLVIAQSAARKAEIEILESKTMTKAEMAEKLAKIDAEFVAIRKQAAERDVEHSKQLTEIEKKAGRPGAGATDSTPEQAEYRKAFALYLRKGSIDGLQELQRKAMNSGTDSAGGYLVLPEMDLTIDRIAQTMGGLAPLCDSATIGTAKWEKVVKNGGMAMRRIADGGAGGETTEPTFAKVQIDVHTAEVEPWIFNETLEDARIDLEADLANEAAIGFAEGLNSELVTGNGVGTCRGITAYTNVLNSAYAWGSIGYVVTGATAAFPTSAPADKIVNLQHSLKAQYRQGAYFVMNDSTLGTVRQMKDGSGAYYLWNPDAAAGFGGRLLGSPVVIDDNFANIGAGAYAIAFGNFKRGYQIVYRAGTSLIRDNITAKGQTKFNFRRRFGGGIKNYEAIKLFKVATS
jgi:HK97 family phage major capsid protein